MGNFGGHAWATAENNGRIRPGRGPYFTRRVLPGLAPMLRKDALDSGVPRSAVDRSDRPTRGVVIPPEAEGPFPERLGPFGWTHADPGIYRWDIITRLRAHWLLARDSVACGWVAAALHGLPYWADSEPVVLYSRRTRRSPRDTTRAQFRTPPGDLTTVCPDPMFPDLRCVDAATAAAQCLSTILRGRKTWWVPAVPGLTDREIRAIQFIDAFLQCTVLTTRQILAAARGKVDRRTMVHLLDLCDYGAQSPMETVMRLSVKDALPTPEHPGTAGSAVDATRAGHARRPHIWTSQVAVSLSDGTVVDDSHRGRRTTPDLACTSLRVALYYDGRHHDGDDQKGTDFRLFQKLRDLGWEVVRINRDLLRDREEMMRQVDAAIGRAVAGTSA